MIAVTDHAWFLTFWGFLIALGVVEYARAIDPAAASRRVRWPINIGFGVLNGLVASLLPISTVAAASWAQSRGFGLLNALSLPAAIAVVATVLFRTLAQYGLHRFAHVWPPLWAVHRVHHSDTCLDGSTGLRFHPIELFISMAVLVPLSIVMGLSPVALAALETVEILGGILTHTSLRLPEPAERALRPYIVTPALHRLHHSNHQPETDSNYGALLVFWDRLFGTYLAESKREPEVFRTGLDTVAPDDASNLEWLLAGTLRKEAARNSPTCAPKVDSSET